MCQSERVQRIGVSKDSHTARRCVRHQESPAKASHKEATLEKKHLRVRHDLQDPNLFARHTECDLHKRAAIRARLERDHTDKTIA